MKNPYSEPCMEDKMPCNVSHSLKELREMNAKRWQEGYEAGYKMGYGDAVYIYDADSKKTVIIGL